MLKNLLSYLKLLHLFLQLSLILNSEKGKLKAVSHYVQLIYFPRMTNPMSSAISGPARCALCTLSGASYDVILINAVESGASRGILRIDTSIHRLNEYGGSCGNLCEQSNTRIKTRDDSIIQDIPTPLSNK